MKSFCFDLAGTWLAVLLLPMAMSCSSASYSDPQPESAEEGQDDMRIEEPDNSEGVDDSEPIRTKVNPVDNAPMAWIEGGEFTMGSNVSDLEALMRRYRWDKAWIEYQVDIYVPDMQWSDYVLNETPGHRVTVEGFWMYRHEVTAAQYRDFCQATGHPVPPEKEWEYWGRQPDDHPVIGVTWNDAQAYCKWANARLPTEAEWEYAACGGQRRVFPWGDRWDRSKANSASYHVGQDLHASDDYGPFFNKHYGGTKVMTTPVGSFPANSLGLFDMAGNVSEWCEDQFDRYPGNRAQHPYDHGPFGYARGSRVVRGGWWGSLPYELRCTSRSPLAPVNKSTESGFRCVVSP